MRFVLFYHSILSDWNNSHAHFLRGMATELIERGHEVRVYEPLENWSLENLRAEHGEDPLRAFHEAYPRIRCAFYETPGNNMDALLDGADVVIVHEWNSPDLVRMIGEHRAQNKHYSLLFHDTHHRSITDAASMRQFDLSNYDGVLAYGEVIRQIYLDQGWAQRAWTWHEAADVRVFKPLPHLAEKDDLVWIGNWGDNERVDELRDFLINPVRKLGLRALVHGVRYPEKALAELQDAGIQYGGWIANYAVPQVFAAHKCTVHIPRRPYARRLRGVPTIRPFEAHACGIPLISAPWEDAEGLFAVGKDFLVARNSHEMTVMLYEVTHDEALAAELARNGRETILRRHTCAHRADELVRIVNELRNVDSQHRAQQPARPQQHSNHHKNASQ